MHFLHDFRLRDGLDSDRQAVFQTFGSRFSDSAELAVAQDSLEGVVSVDVCLDCTVQNYGVAHLRFGDSTADWGFYACFGVDDADSH